LPIVLKPRALEQSIVVIAGLTEAVEKADVEIVTTVLGSIALVVFGSLLFAYETLVRIVFGPGSENV
jgi:hypothetical protein